MADERTLLIPDRPGNNGTDSLRNVAQSHVGLLFLVPGMSETLRVSGTAETVTDADVVEPLSMNFPAPRSGDRRLAALPCVVRPPVPSGSCATLT